MNNVLIKNFVKFLSLLAMLASVWFGFIYFKGMSETPYSIVIAIGMFVVAMNVFTGTLENDAVRDKIRRICYIALVALLVFLNVFRAMFWTA
jgi:hypothetical protein